MKSKLLALLVLLFAKRMVAQLTITPGAQFSVFTNTRLTLHNTDLINNGDLMLATISPVTFTGDASTIIGGDEAIRFFKLEINKSADQAVSLKTSINVGSEISFASGFLDLNGFDIDLENSGVLTGEREDSRIIGEAGGHVLLNVRLDAPSGINPGNLGLILTSSRDLGDVVIKRGHQSQVNGTGLAGSVTRYFDMIPANASRLDGTLRFNYFDGELNGFDENSLNILKSHDAINWVDLGFDSRDVAVNFVEKTNIDSFGRFTLSGLSRALPVNFASFDVQCDNNKVTLVWKTAQEQNSSRFSIERIITGNQWTVLGSLPAAGNSSTEKTYSFVDHNPQPSAQYRIAEHSIDGRVHYSAILQSSCVTVDDFRLWPNPARVNITINVVSSNASPFVVKVFDGKGALVKLQRTTISPGSNQVSIDIGSLTRGYYAISAEWNNGLNKKTVLVLKE